MQQHDVQELNRILFDAIESSLVGTSGEHLIAQLFHGTSVQKVSDLMYPLFIYTSILRSHVSSVQVLAKERKISWTLMSLFQEGQGSKKL